VCNRLIGDTVPGLTPDNQQLRAAIRTIELLRAAEHPIRFGNCIPQCFEASSSTGCTAGSTFATIDPWGRMRPCNHAPLIAGDLKTQSIENVWNGKVMQQWRALVPEACTTCAAFALCHGGCRAQDLLLGQKQDPLMQYPIHKRVEQETDTLKLYAGLRPIGQFMQRKDGTKEILIHKSQVVILPQDYEPLACQLNGSFTLESIKDTYGAAALDWIGELYTQGMVMWM
jgi:radical SAM protein with 4Fe4S-binding SPASM domain